MPVLPTPTIISAEELQKIRSHAHEDSTELPNIARSQRRAELKKLSEQRYKKWPNTLENLRLKKMSFMKDKAEAEEEARREVDRQEAEIRKHARMNTIKRANDLLYEQTDKMKMLRSQKMYAECLSYRSSQIKEKEDTKEKVKEVAAKYHQSILENVAKLEAIEQKKIEDRRRSIEETARIRAEQLAEVMKKRDAEFTENEAIGQAMKRRADEDVIAAAEAYEEKQKLAAETTANMYAMNAQLKIVKQELKQQEALENARRDAEVQVIEDRKVARKALEQKRFENKQRARQQIIDAAVEAMSKQQNTAQAIQEKQEKEINDRQDKAEADKKAALDADWAFTVSSRNQQLKAKRDQIEADKELEARLLAAWKEKMDLAHEKELDKDRRNREITHEIKRLQYQEGVQARRKKVEDRVVMIEQERLLREVAAQDDAKFVETVNNEVRRYLAEGKPVYTLLRALDYRQPVLIPAPLDPSKRGKKGE